MELQRVAGRTAVIRAQAHSPLKLLSPRPTRAAGQAAWVFSSTYGGGLVGGDQISLQAHLGPGAVGLLGTQASTKIYRAASPAAECRQSLHAIVESDAVLAILPDPVTCFAGAKFAQGQRIELAQGASLVLLDWLTSGRQARGERWAFGWYRSDVEVSIAGRPVFADALLLDGGDLSAGPLDGPQRMGRLDCLATLLMLGPALQAEAAKLLEFVNAQSVPRLHGSDTIHGKGDGLANRMTEAWFAASPVAGGAILRVAGPTTESVARCIRHRLSFMISLLGDDPWRRRY